MDNFVQTTVRSILTYFNAEGVPTSVPADGNGLLVKAYSEYQSNLALGKVPGEKGLNKFGRNIEIDSGVSADIWDGGHTLASGGTSLIWLAPTASRIHTIASSSANDTTGGTGANQVAIKYLPDWDTAERTETVIGNLNAGIVMHNAAVMIHRMFVVPQASSTTINAGDITATAASDGTVTARIRVGEGQTQMAIYGVPSTQRVLLDDVYASANKAGGNAGLVDVSLIVNPSPDVNPAVFLVKHTFGLQTTGVSSDQPRFIPPKVIDGPAIVKIHCLSGTNDMDVSAGFNGAVVP